MLLKFHNNEVLFFNDIGLVETVSDGIVNIHGLAKVANGEMINFCVGSDNIYGLVLNLEVTHVSAIVLGLDSKIKPVNMFLGNMF
jgi:F-type H+-transporting ATPase subunit alpha